MKVQLHGKEGLPIVNKRGEIVKDHQHQELHIGDEVAIIESVGQHAKVHLATIVRQTPATIFAECKYLSYVRRASASIAMDRPQRILRIRTYDQIKKG